MSVLDSTRYKALSTLQIWEDNYNHNDVARIALSIRRFGFNSTPRLWRSDTVMAGNHSVMALRLVQQEGPKPGVDRQFPPRNVVVDKGDWLIQWVDLSHLDELEAKAFAIADNELARRAVTDDELLAEYLREIAARDEQLIEAVGYDTATFEQMMTYLTSDLLPEAFPEYDESVTGSVKMVTCPHCGREFPA